MSDYEKLMTNLAKGPEEFAQERADADEKNREIFSTCNSIIELADTILYQEGPIPHGEFSGGPLHEEIDPELRRGIVEKIYNTAREYITNPNESEAILESIGDTPLRERLGQLLATLFSNPSALVEARNWTEEGSAERAVIDKKLQTIEAEAQRFQQ